MSKVIRAAFIITLFTAIATFMFAQHNHGTAPSAGRTTCSCCANAPDGKMAVCCDAEKCKMDDKGNCATTDCCKKTGANACTKACAKSEKTSEQAGMKCGRKGGCCGHGESTTETASAAEAK
jgi:hypothetical protein